MVVLFCRLSGSFGWSHVDPVVPECLYHSVDSGWSHVDPVVPECLYHSVD
jgi:hypothetical protein